MAAEVMLGFKCGEFVKIKAHRGAGGLLAQGCSCTPTLMDLQGQGYAVGDCSSDSVTSARSLQYWLPIGTK